MSSIPDNLKGGISSLPSSVKPVQSAASGAKIGDTLGAGIGTLVPCVTNANASLSVTPTSGGGGGGGSYPANPLVSSILIQGGKIGYDSNASVMMFSPASISSIYVSSVNGQPIGGGGGGGGVNPVVSTLTFSKGDQATNTTGTLFMNTLLNVRDPNVLSPQNFNFQFATSNNTNAYPSFYQKYLSTFNGMGISAPDSNVINTGAITIASSVDGRSAIVAQCANGALSTLSILADTIQMPTNVSTANLQVSTINGVVPGGATVPANLSVSSLTVAKGGSITMSNATSLNFTNNDGVLTGISSINNTPAATQSFSGFYTNYSQGGSNCSLGTTYWSLVNNIGKLVMTFPETPGANWFGANKFFIWGGGFTGGNIAFPNSWYVDDVSISCPDGTGSYVLVNWTKPTGGQLNVNAVLNGTPSTFVITAQVRAP